MLFEVRADALRVRGTAILVAHRVDEQRHGLALQAERLEETHAHDDHLGVCHRIGRAEAFNAHLVKLAQTALLRTFAAEHGASVEQLGRNPALRHEVVLRDGAHDARRALRAQRQLLVRLERLAFRHLLERADRADREDLFARDVGALPRRSREKLGKFEHGGLDGLVAVEGKDLLRPAAKRRPRARLCGQEVLRAFWCLIAHYWASSAFSSAAGAGASVVSGSTGVTSMGLAASSAAWLSESWSSRSCLRWTTLAISANRSGCASA